MQIKPDIEFGTTIALWGGCPDRFLSGGYKKEISFEDKIKLISKIKDIKGVDLYGDWDVNKNNVEEIGKILKKYGLKTYLVTGQLVLLKFGSKFHYLVAARAQYISLYLYAYFLNQLIILKSSFHTSKLSFYLFFILAILA